MISHVVMEAGVTVSKGSNLKELAAGKSELLNRRVMYIRNNLLSLHEELDGLIRLMVGLSKKKPKCVYCGALCRLMVPLVMGLEPIWVSMLLVC